MELRAVEMEDAQLFYRWENDTSLWKYGSTLRPLSHFDVENYILRSQSSTFYAEGQMRLMVDVTEGGQKETVGCVDLFDFAPRDLRAELGVLIDRKHRAKGYSVPALSLLWDLATRVYSLKQLYAYVSCDNEAAKRMMLAAGYDLSATLPSWVRFDGEYRDVFLFQKLNNRAK